jgi:hypothetical protein
MIQIKDTVTTIRHLPFPLSDGFTLAWARWQLSDRNWAVSRNSNSSRLRAPRGVFWCDKNSTVTGDSPYSPVLTDTGGRLQTTMEKEKQQLTTKVTKLLPDTESRSHMTADKGLIATRVSNKVFRVTTIVCWSGVRG